LIRDRDMLFAEAVIRFRASERWWPDAAFERQHIMPEQEARYEADAWEVAIGEYLAKVKVTMNEPIGKKVTVMDVAIGGLKFEKSRLSTTDQRRITAAMERLGWQRREQKGTGGVRWWIPL
jgi:predicted P-loop ATPase